MLPVVHKFGLAGESIASQSFQWAVRSAVRLQGLTSHVYPRDDDNYLSIVAEETIDAALNFSIHARRFLEIEQLRMTVGPGRWKVENEAAALFCFESDLWEAINGILHARHLQVVFLEHGAKQFTKIGDLAVVALEIESDRRSRYHVEPYALCYSFFSGD